MDKIVEKLVEGLNYKPNKYQIDVFNGLIGGDYNMLINAVAGSGKTTTLLNILELIKDKKSLAVAFNRSIRNEFSKKVNILNLYNTNVQTAHSFGYYMLKKSGRIDDNIILNNKYKKLLRLIVNYNYFNKNDLIKEFPDLTKEQLEFTSHIHISKPILNKFDLEETKRFYNNIHTLIDFLRLYLVDLNDDNRINELCEHYGLDLISNEVAISKTLLKIGVGYLSILDYNDMLWLPLKLNIDIDTYDYVLIDECQDINDAARTLLMKAIKPKGKFIAVGDIHQAIYGFAGANSRSFKKLEDMPNTKKFPLSLCYRCGSNIIKKANELVPEIEASKITGEGMVTEEGTIKDINPNDMVLCRFTAPLVKLAFNFLKNGIVVLIKGRDIAEQIKKLILDTKKDDIEEILIKLERDLYKIELYLKNKGKKLKKDIEYQTLKDKTDIIKILAEESKNKDQLLDRLDSMFSDEKVKNAVIFSTIHKAKGLESDNIHIIERNRIPSMMARQEWELEQENNLLYVAYTRAKKHLNIITDWNYHMDCDTDLRNKLKDIGGDKFVGHIGDKISISAEIVELREVNVRGKEVKVITLQDEHGNLYTKWGDIPFKFIDYGRDADVGNKAKFSATITKHNQFNGNKYTVINALDRYNKYLKRY